MNLPSGSRKGQAASSLEDKQEVCSFRFHARRKENPWCLSKYNFLLFQTITWSPGYRIDALILDCFFFFFPSFPFNGTSESLRQLFFGKRRYKLDIGGSLDADLPIPKRLVVILGILSSTESYIFGSPPELSRKTLMCTHILCELAGLHTDSPLLRTKSLGRSKA